MNGMNIIDTKFLRWFPTLKSASAFHTKTSMCWYSNGTKRLANTDSKDSYKEVWNMKDIYSSMVDPNIAWTAYKSQRLGQLFPIAEAANIDHIFDYSIKNNLPEPFGVYTWESSYLMLDTLENLAFDPSHSEIDTAQVRTGGLRGKIVCDLCCGTGLISLLAHRMGAKVIALDYNEFSLRLANLSFKVYNTLIPKSIIPSLPDPVEYRLFDMANPNHHIPSCDYLLLSDVLYSTEIAKLVSDRVIEALRIGVPNIVITDPGREFAKLFAKYVNEELISDRKLADCLLHPRIEFEGFTNSHCKLGQRMIIRRHDPKMLF